MVNQTYSASIFTNSGVPQDSTLLLHFIQMIVEADIPYTFILKFSDDTTLLSLLGTADHRID